jgi:hypothetical protein
MVPRFPMWLNTPVYQLAPDGARITAACPLTGLRVDVALVIAYH